jgi:8-oxo-dGTP pyrophosphatase MutT (NUDIX family)
MIIKIYFGNKPLFLCDVMNAEIESYIHHDDAVFIDEFSPPAINSMIHEMQQDKVHAGVYLYPKLDELKKAIWKKFTVIQAAGGLVRNEKKEILFIFRRGKWDLPKGKVEEGENIEECALREVQEETGLNEVTLQKFLITTYHTYPEKGKHILKESYWFEMKAAGKQKLVPQLEEDITDIQWINKNKLDTVLKNTFPSIRDVIEADKLVAGRKL